MPFRKVFPIFAVLNILNRASDRRPLCRWLFLCQPVNYI
nr:MAG TPA: Xin repeat protein [Caudoviricetes sp.]